MKNLSKPEICTLFGCSVQQLNNQYAANAKQLASMYNKASKTGKKQGGLSAPELLVYAEKYSVLAENDLTCITIECKPENVAAIITAAVKRGFAHERFNGGVKIYA